MVTGFLSLAYVAELSVVFNLAYAELKKDRYLKKSEVEIERIMLQVLSDKNSATESPSFPKSAAIYTQVSNLGSEDRLQRSGAWKIEKANNNGGKPKNIYFRRASFFYAIFKRQTDKLVSYLSIGITALIIVLCTLLDHTSGVLPTSSIEVCWWMCYIFLTLSLVLPLFFIYSGRDMSSKLETIIDAISNTFGSSLEKQLGDVLDKK